MRDGVLADRQSFYLENAGRPRRGRGGRGVRAPVLRHLAGDPAAGDRAARRCTRRGGAGGGAQRAARRRRSRCATPSAATSAASSSWPSATRGWRSTRTGCAPSTAASQRIEALEGLQQDARHGADPDADRVLRHLEPRRDAHGRLDGRVRGRRAEEVRLPPLRDPRGRAGRLRGDERGAVAADGAVRRAARALAAREGLRRELRRGARR